MGFETLHCFIFILYGVNNKAVPMGFETRHIQPIVWRKA